MTQTNKIIVPILTYKEYDVDFNMVWETLLGENILYEEDGTKSFTSTKQLIDYLKDDFADNYDAYIDYIFHIDDIDEYTYLCTTEGEQCINKLLTDYNKFIYKKFKGVHIKDLYDKYPYQK